MSGETWRGKSVYQITQRLEEASQYAGALRLMKLATDERIRQLRSEAMERLVEVAEELKGYDPDHLYLSYSVVCPYAPTSRCVYDSMEDPEHDGCLFCGEPQERK